MACVAKDVEDSNGHLEELDGWEDSNGGYS